MPITEIGRMTERVTFFKKKVGRGEHNEPVTTNEQLFSCWCIVKNQYIKDIVATVGTNLQNTVNIIIRDQQKMEIKTEWLIDYRGSVYEIVQVNPDTLYRQYKVIIARKKGK